MKKVLLSSSVIALAIFFAGCSHQVAAPTASTIEVHSSYDETIPGNWSVTVDESSTTFERDISPQSYACSAHSFMFSPGDSIKISAVDALKKTFENTTINKSTPDIEQMKRENLSGYAVIDLEGFNPRINCTQGFWSVKCNVDVDLEFGVEVRGREGKLLDKSVGSRKSVDGDSGAFCGSISELIGEAYRQALSDSLEKMVEEISNSARIREYSNTIK